MTTVTKCLPNGLTVILREFKAVPVVSMQMWVKAGSADERPHEAGLAHVLEHMIFKGTSKRKVGEIARDIESAGGSINAWTSLDETVFHVTVAAQYALDGLEVLTDAISNPSLDAGELEKELPVICEEIRMGKDSPERTVSSELFGAMFNEHPYGRPVIGYRETVEGFHAQDVRDFYKRWYTPSNMMLIAVGDFDAVQLFGEIEKCFGEVQKGRSPRRITRKKEPLQQEDRIRISTISSPECNLAMGLRIPGFQHPDVAALDVMGALLGQGASSRLEMDLVRKAGLASDCSSVCYTPKDEGLFGVFAKASPDKLIVLVEQISRQIQHLTETLAATHEVEKAKKLILSEDAFANETVDGQARKVGYFRLYCDSKGYEKQYTDAVRTVTPTMVREVARKYLVNPISVSVVVPEAQLVSGARPDWMGAHGVKEAALQHAMADAVKRGRKVQRMKHRVQKDVHTHVFDTQDVVMVRPVKAQTVAARAAFLGGQRLEPVKYAGVGPLLGSLLVRGTQSLSSLDIATKLDSWACAVNGFSGRNSVGISGEFLSENYNSVLELMADCLCHPSFEPSEIEIERGIFTQMVESSLTNARAVVFMEFQKALFGKHPYGRSVYGTPNTLANIDQKALTQYHKRTIQNGNMVLAVVGDVDVDEVFSLAEQHFVKPAKGHTTLPTLAWTPKKGPLQIRKNMTKEQSHIVIGFPGTILSNRERFAVDVLSEILGGHGGRLFDIVREKQSLAYDVSSFSFDGLEPGFIACYGATSVGNEQKFVSTILKELEKLKKTPPPRAELDRVIRFLVGSREIAQQRFAARAADMSLSYLYDLGIDSSSVYIREISKITGKQVQQAAKKYLNFENMIISAVGPGVQKLNFV